MDRLRFTPYAWAKLLFLRDHGNTEVSFYALTDKEDISKVIDVLMVPQKCSMAYTEFKDDGIADFFDKMVDAGHEIENFARIWVHTHPGASASPSNTDEKTFKDAFGNNHWAIMAILGTTGETTCRLRYQSQPLSPKFPGRTYTEEIPITVLLPIAGMDTFLEIKSKEACTCINWKNNKMELLHKEDWIKEYDANWSSMYGGTNWNSGNQSSHSTNGTTTTTSPKGQYIRQPAIWIPGPGWRISEKGTWVCTESLRQEDIKNGIKISPSYAGSFQEKMNLERVAEQEGASKLLPRPLTRREKEYIQEHGSLQGFVPPDCELYKRPIADADLKEAGVLTPSKLVSLTKLECDRNLLTTQDDGDFGWLGNKIEEQLEERNYYVILGKDDYIPEKHRGQKWKNVYATSALAAVQRVHAKLGIPPFRGKFNDAETGETIYVPAPEDIIDNDDTDLVIEGFGEREARDAEVDAEEEARLDEMDAELNALWAEEDAGKITAAERTKQEDLILAKYDQIVTDRIDREIAAKDDEVIDSELGLVHLPDVDGHTATNEGLANFASHEEEYRHIPGGWSVDI